MGKRAESGIKLDEGVVRGAEPREKVYDLPDTDLVGLLLRVRPNGRKAYYFRFRNADGRQRMMKVGDAAKLSAQAARAEARKLAARVVLEEDPMAERHERRGATLGEYLDGPWREHVLSKRRSQASARKDYDRLKAVFSGLLKRRLADLTGWDIERWRTERRKGGASITTVNVEVATLRSALSAAVRMGLLQEHPLRNIQRLPNPDGGQRVRYMTHEERRAIEAALEAREERLRGERARFNQWLAERHRPALPDLSGCMFADHLRCMYVLATTTGVRRGEMFDLEWGDVDLGRRVLTVRAAAAKSGKSRHIPLNKVAHAALAGWRAQTQGDGLVFPSPQGGGRFDNINTAWRGVLAEAGVTGLRWHDLRHEFASRLVQSGVDLNVVRELLGHGSMQMTLRYAHLSPRVKAEAVALIEDWGEGDGEARSGRYDLRRSG